MASDYTKADGDYDHKINSFEPENNSEENSQVFFHDKQHSFVMEVDEDFENS